VRRVGIWWTLGRYGYTSRFHRPGALGRCVDAVDGAGFTVAIPEWVSRSGPKAPGESVSMCAFGTRV
jgi:hypothetical protein